MKIGTPTAQWFSNALLRLYAAPTLAELDEAFAVVEAAGKGEPDASPWLIGLLGRHVEHRRTQLRGGAGADKSGVLAKLTRREREVLQRIALGETDAAIGRRLGISTKTASKHVENILRKLGVETRTAAVAAARVSRP